MNGRLSISLFLFSATLSLISCDSTTPDGLPPDPGEEGMQTLEGIDSDGDGVRDDIQRHIALTYDDQPTRDVLTILAKAEQDGLLRAAQGDAVIDPLAEMFRAVECTYQLRSSETHLMLADFRDVVVNTPARESAYIRLNSQASGETFVLSDNSVDSCQQLGVAAANVLPVSNAHSGGEQCDYGSDVVIAFSNGMFNDIQEATYSLLVLRAITNNSNDLPADALPQWILSYNFDENIAAQLLEVGAQSFILSLGHLFRVIAGIDPMPDGLQIRLVNFASTIDANAFVHDNDLSRHILVYQNYLLEGNRIIIVSHSQGNFYANQAFQSISSLSVGIVSVATPATQVGGNGPYVTLTHDRLIQGVRLLVPAVLSANETNVVRFTDLGHSFAHEYITGNPSKDSITVWIRDHYLNLPAPPETAGSGPITVTLSWGAEPDVDLHVFEPNGTHVYYANRQGESGFLDVDDTSGFGPEHYYVACSTLETGTYHVGVNYYRGNSPETALIGILAGDVSRLYKADLAEERGSSGNESPIPVADISVSQNSDGTYRFDVSSSLLAAGITDPQLRGSFPK